MSRSTFLSRWLLLWLIFCAAHAQGDAANNFVLDRTTYFANDQVVINVGVLTIDTTDNFVPASNIYVIRNAEPLAPNTPLAPLDPTGVPNVIQGFGGGGFIDETIGFTEPVGTIGGGVWAIVEDANQNGIFDGPDTVLRNAFTVNLLVSVPSISSVTEILRIKLSAFTARNEWQATASLFNASFTFAKLLSGAINITSTGVKGVIQFLRGQIVAQLNLGILPATPTPMNWGKKIAKDLMADASAHYAGIAADPPDPAYQQLTLLGPQFQFFAATTDPLDTSLTTLAQATQAEASIAEAFLRTMERYQGAEQAGNGDWALVHARQLQDYATLLADSVERSSVALAAMADTLQNDPRDFDGLAAAFSAFSDTIETTGFSAEQQQLLANLGYSQAEFAALRAQIGAIDLSGLSRATLVAQLGTLQLNHATVASDMRDLATFMGSVINQLANDPLVADGYPAASAGGPYVTNEGLSVVLDASASTAGAGSIIAYSWDLDGDGEFDDAFESQPTVVFELAGNWLIGLKINNSDGHADIAYVNVQVNDTIAPPVIDSFNTPATEPLVIVGVTQLFSVTATGSTGTPTIEWFLNGVSVSTADSFALTPVAADIGLHILEAHVSDPNPAAGTVIQAWTLNVQEPDTDGDGYTGTGGDCNDADASVNPAAVEIIDNGIDDDCNPTTEDPDQPPSAEFFTDPQIGLPGTSTGFRNASTDPNGDLVSYLWDFGDGSPTSTDQDPDHTYQQAYPFDVTLTVTDSKGNSDSITQQVEILGPAQNQRISDPDFDSRGVLGTQSNGNALGGVAVSEDGRWVAFSSVADNLVPWDTNESRDVFVADTTNGRVERVSVHTNGTEGRKNIFSGQLSGKPTISPDGRFVSFVSFATNLIGEDLDDNGSCDAPAELVAGACSGHQGEVFIRDRDTDGNGIFDEPGGVETRLASRYWRLPLPSGFGTGIASAVMSGDARFVAFESRSADHVEGVGPVGVTSTPHVFMVDTQTNEIRNVSRDINGAPVRAFLTQRGGRMISDDGRYLVWYSHFGMAGSSGGIVGSDTDGDGRCDVGCSAYPGLNADVYLYDWVNDTNRQISINSSGEAAQYNETPNSTPATGGGSGSLFATISANGRWIAFLSSANNLYLDASGAPNLMAEADSRNPDVYLHDRDADGNGSYDENGGFYTEIVSLNLDGQANGQISRERILGGGSTLSLAHVGDDGRFVAFYGAPGAYVDPSFPLINKTMLVHDRLTDNNAVPFLTLGGKAVAGTFYMSGNGRYLLTETLERDLVGIDTNGDGRCQPHLGETGCDVNNLYDVYLQDRDPDGDSLLGTDDSCLNSRPGEAVDAAGCKLPLAIDVAISPAIQSLPPGFDATFDVTVTNTGAAELLNVQVTDLNVPDCDFAPGTLVTGGEVTYSCTAYGVAVAFDHTLEVSAYGGAGDRVTDTTDASVTLFNAAIDVRHGPDPREVEAGNNYLLTVAVSNIGDIALADVNVVADAIPACSRVLGNLGAGQSFGYSCLGPTTTTDFVSRVEVFGQPPLGLPVSDFDTASVLVSAPVDTSPPELSVPDDIIAEASGPLGATVVFTVSAIDDSDPDPLIACTASSGSVFALGVTQVECSATDAGGNQSFADFTIHVVDTTPPVITVPDDIITRATDKNGALVDFQVDAVDLVDLDPLLTCSELSGSVFPIGNTSVFCEAFDDSGNGSAAAFTITIEPFKKRKSDKKKSKKSHKNKSDKSAKGGKSRKSEKSGKSEKSDKSAKRGKNKHSKKGSRRIKQSGKH